MKKQTEKKESPAKEKLPGYPPYPAEEDIMSGNAGNRVDLNVEDLNKNIPESQLTKNKPGKKSDNRTPEIVPGTEADLTPEDMNTLGSPERSNDGGDDELLDDLAIGPDFSGDDLDVPGSDADDAMEDIGSEDEENNYYSRGQE